MKTCTKCGQTKNLDEFYKHKPSKDGRYPRCKVCLKEDHREYYQRKREKVIEKSRAYYRKNTNKKREYDKEYRHKNYKKQRERKREWGTSERGKRLIRASHERYLSTPEGRNRHRARGAVNDEVRRGRMPRASTLKCKDCGNRARNYHHYLGYDKPHWLDVVPLCIRCHNKCHTD